MVTKQKKSWNPYISTRYVVSEILNHHCEIITEKISNLCVRGFSGEHNFFVKPEIRLNPSPVNTRLKPSPVNTKFAYSLSPDFLFLPSPDFVYTRETSTMFFSLLLYFNIHTYIHTHM